MEGDYCRIMDCAGERRERIIRWHVHQKHNNVSIKIELIRKQSRPGGNLSLEWQGS